MKTINIEVTPKDVIKAKAKKPDSKWLTEGEGRSKKVKP